MDHSVIVSHVPPSCDLRGMRLGLVYLPEESGREACVRFGKSIVGERTPRAVVGADALPHVSLVHVESDEEPEVLWREAKASIAPVVALDVLALGLLRYDTPYNAPPAAGGATMAWLVIPCSPALREAERGAVGLPFVLRAGATTYNGDLYQPHVTLAIWDGDLAPRGRELPQDLFGKRMTARLALGVIGPDGTYVRSLYTN
jgi:hypothetical protein